MTKLYVFSKIFTMSERGNRKWRIARTPRGTTREDSHTRGGAARLRETKRIQDHERKTGIVRILDTLIHRRSKSEEFEN